MTTSKIFKTKHYLYGTYYDMKRRCYDPKRKDYKHYGAKGITVCDRWLESFWNFVEDMGDRPDGYSIDRIDNNKNYSPENCRWATQETQVQNSSKCINAKGVTRYVNKSGNVYFMVQYKRKHNKQVKCFKTELEAKEFYETIKRI